MKQFISWMDCPNVSVLAYIITGQVVRRCCVDLLHITSLHPLNVAVWPSRSLLLLRVQ